MNRSILALTDNIIPSLYIVWSWFWITEVQIDRYKYNTIQVDNQTEKLIYDRLCS